MLILLNNLKEKIMMITTKKLAKSIVVASFSFMALSHNVLAEAEQPISEAEKMLFMTDHLKNVNGPAVIQYHFKRGGQLEATFEDQVKVVLKKNGNDKTVAVTFLTGEHKAAELPPVDDATGNPVLKAYLERDLTEMKRLTGGATAYFRKRIRLALVDKAEVKPTTFTYDGKEIKGTEISVRPFVDDPMKQKMEKYVNKNYVFVLSEQVPGGIYQIRTAIPASGKIEGGKGNASSMSMIEETMTLSKQTKSTNKT
jgi:hypothetical protein